MCTSESPTLRSADRSVHARTVDGFADAYFQHRERLGGLRALRETLRQSIASIEDKQTQHHRYALLRGHESFEPILEHLDDDDWQTLSSKLLSVIGDCCAAVPHVSVRRILALYDAGVLDIIHAGPDGSFSDAGDRGVIVSTIDGDIRFDALIGERGQAAAPLADLPFPHLTAASIGPDAKLVEPFQLDLGDDHRAAVYCLAMPQILDRHPFSQGSPDLCRARSSRRTRHPGATDPGRLILDPMERLAVAGHCDHGGGISQATRQDGALR